MVKNPDWSALSPPELVKVCPSLWVNLNVEGQSRFSGECREALGGGWVIGLGLNRVRQEGI